MSVMNNHIISVSLTHIENTLKISRGSKADTKIIKRTTPQTPVNENSVFHSHINIKPEKCANKILFIFFANKIIFSNRLKQINHILLVSQNKTYLRASTCALQYSTIATQKNSFSIYVFIIEIKSKSK